MRLECVKWNGDCHRLSALYLHRFWLFTHAYSFLTSIWFNEFYGCLSVLKHLSHEYVLIMVLLCVKIAAIWPIVWEEKRTMTGIQFKSLSYSSSSIILIYLFWIFPIPPNQFHATKINSQNIHIICNNNKTIFDDSIRQLLKEWFSNTALSF